MEKSKKLRIGITTAIILCLLGVGLYFLWGALAERKAGPGTDMEAIKKYLSRYSNDYEDHAKDKKLAVIDHIPKLNKLEPWYDFAEKVRAGEPAWVTMVEYTIEGDSIFYYLHYDGTEFLYVKDTTRDKFGSHVYLKEKFTKLSEFTETAKDGGTIYSAVLSNMELTSTEHVEQMFREVYPEMEAGKYDPETAEYQRFPYAIIRTWIEDETSGEK